jgi:hypothetical protein
MKTKRLMLFKIIIVVYSENLIIHINMLYGQNTRIFGVQPGGSYNNHCASQVFNI